MDTILNIHQISHSYHTLKGETPALCDISFSVNQGEFLAIVGPSGQASPPFVSLLRLLKPNKEKFFCMKTCRRTEGQNWIYATARRTA